MSRIRKRKRAAKRAAQVTVESARITGETILCAGMSPEREAEIRKQYYRDREAAGTEKQLDKLDCLMLRVFEGAGPRGLTPDEAHPLICKAIADSGDSEVQALADADPEFCEWRKWQSDDTSAPATDITPEYLDKLRLDCLRAANNSMPGADPHAVVRAAAADLEVKLRFLRGQSQEELPTTKKARTEKLENWLDDHPGKTVADFAEVSARSATHGPLTWSEAHDFVTRGNRAGLDIVDFETWEVMQEFVADGYWVRLGGGKYQRTEKTSPFVWRDPERLPGEDDATYWKRFWRLLRENIEELEREQRRKEKRPEVKLRFLRGQS
jgi:hypothetical protein